MGAGEESGNKMNLQTLEQIIRNLRKNGAKSPKEAYETFICMGYGASEGDFYKAFRKVSKEEKWNEKN
jgi:hypothetical protein